MALPKPVWSDNDIKMAWKVVNSPSSLIWNAWNKDPTKMAVLRAMVSCQVRIGGVGDFGSDMVKALARQSVRSLHPYSLEVENSVLLNYSQVVFPPKDILTSLSRYYDFWRSPVGDVPEENQ